MFWKKKEAEISEQEIEKLLHSTAILVPYSSEKPQIISIPTSKQIIALKHQIWRQGRH